MNEILSRIQEVKRLSVKLSSARSLGYFEVLLQAIELNLDELEPTVEFAGMIKNIRKKLQMLVEYVQEDSTENGASLEEVLTLLDELSAFVEECLFAE